ncbi:MAG: hypothetical protein ACYC3V_14420 [Chloroflexota bacterium]
MKQAIFVRPLTDDERKQLEAGFRSSDAFVLRRCQILLATRPWWSRLATPGMHAWTEAGKPLHLVEQSVANDDPDPKALACYGMLVRWFGAHGLQYEQPWLRFVDGRPVKSPWPNPIEPRWIHGKRKVAERARLLTAGELRDRICSYFGCHHEDHLAIPEKVA